MEKRSFQIPESEMAVFFSLISQGYILTLNEKFKLGKDQDEDELDQDEFWERVWGLKNSEIFCSHKKTEQEIRDFFSRPFEAYEPNLYFYVMGTHCGMFHYEMGWVHEARTTQEDLDDAVVPFQKQQVI